MTATQKRLFEMKAEIIQAAPHPIRTAVIDYIGKGEQCVCDIVEHVDAKRSNVSRHLALMLKAGVLDCRIDGLKVFYQLKTPCILDFMGCGERGIVGTVEGDVVRTLALGKAKFFEYLRD